MLRTAWITIFLGVTVLAAAQEYEIAGKVSDQNNSPLPGANILIKGTPNGTVADAEGNFKLKISDASATLLFAFEGYKLLEQQITRHEAVTGKLEVSLVEKFRFRKHKGSARLIQLRR